MNTDKGILHAAKIRLLNVACVAVIAASASGATYADNEFGSNNIIDDSITSADIKNETITSTDIKNNSIVSNDLVAGAINNSRLGNNSVTSVKVVDNSLTGDDIADGSIGSAEILDESITNADLGTDSVQATEVADNSLDSGEIVDFGLSNEDIGVLEAQVNSDGTLARSGHIGTTASTLGTGTYVVDFGLNVSFCTPIATQGEAGIGGAGGAIMGVTDRAGNANAYFVTTRDAAGNLVSTSFQLITVC